MFVVIVSLIGDGFLIDWVVDFFIVLDGWEIVLGNVRFLEISSGCWFVFDFNGDLVLLVLLEV